MTELAIVATGLRKHFGQVCALDGIDLVVPTGTVLGLLGPNGAGKTTAVRILTTIIEPDDGTAEVLGHDVVADADAVRSRIGLAGQYAAVDENLTGRENLRLVGKLTHLPRDEVRRRADELLEQFDIADAADRPAKTYSGGMRRRLDLAAALVHRPPVLFLDEPTTGLDPRSRIGMWGVIDELVAAGTTVLLTTQYLEEADRLANQIVVIDHGRVIASGTPAELKASMGGTMLALGLADERVAADAAATVARSLRRTPRLDGATVEVALDDGAALVLRVLRALERKGIEPVTLAVREPSLDDVFLDLTGHRASAGAAGDGDQDDQPPDRAEVADEREEVPA